MCQTAFGDWCSIRLMRQVQLSHRGSGTMPTANSSRSESRC